jgi:succinate dehydrogenase / fumarate reductase cytochrome b subunit
MRLLSDSIGRKAVMAVTGLLMVLFVIGHLLGNLSIFAGPGGLNTYAEKLHAIPALVWGTRIVMGVAVLVHLVLAVQITMENSAAKPEKYAKANMLRATFSSQTMIWTGVILGAFVVYHLLHFTFRVTPGLVLGVDALNRFDVYTMVVDAFGRTLTAFVYIVAMVALFLHLSHGIQSAFQTLGLANPRWLPRWETGGKLASGAFLVGFAAIPVFVLVGFLTLK